jgi:hypothetical protein
VGATGIRNDLLGLVQGSGFGEILGYDGDLKQGQVEAKEA